MNLAVDIGNSCIKIGVYENDKVVTITKFLHEEFSMSKIENFEIKNAAISSVVPYLTDIVIESIEKKIKIKPHLIKASSKFNLKLDYRTPESLGIDRICGAEGAFAQFKKENKCDINKIPILTIDFGTATTLNLIKPGAIFSGGIITPGISTMLNSLFSKTAQLPYVDLNEYHEFIGKDTNSCIASGIMNATVGLIEKTISRLKKDFTNSEIKVYLSGGNATLIKPYIGFECDIVNDLVLKGVNEIIKINLIK